MTDRATRPRHAQSLSARLEDARQAHPEAFVRLTAAATAAALAAIGLAAGAAAALVLGPLLAVALGAHPAWLLAVLPGLALGWALGQMLAPELPDREGVALDLATLPRLAELLQHLTLATGGAAPAQVRLTDQDELRLVPTARLGLLGPAPVTLRVGLPVLMALDGPQFAGLLATTLAPQRRGSLAAWVVRLHRRWAQLLARRLPRAPGPRLTGLGLALFGRRVFPPLAARARVLARAEARAGDALAERWTASPAVRQGLQVLAVQRHYLARHFWPAVWAAAARDRRPEAHPLRDLRVLLRHSLRLPEAAHWQREAWRERTDPLSTEPPLRERLGGDEPPPLPGPPAPSAADVLLAGALPALIQAVDDTWRQRVADDWLARHREHRQRRQWRDELARDEAEGRPLPREELLWWARLAQEIDGPAAAEPMARLALARHAAPAEARFRLAQALLAGVPPLEPPARQPELLPAQAEALTLLQGLADEGRESATYAEVMAADPRWRVPAARLLEQQLMRREDFPALQRLRVRLHQLENEAREALALLNDFEGEQTLTPVRWPPRLLRPLQQRLQAEHAVGRAWLWRKTALRAKGWALHILVIERSRTLIQPDPAHWTRDWPDTLEPPLDWRVVDLADPFWKALHRQDLVLNFCGEDAACLHTARARRARAT